MENLNLIDTFSEFKELKNIDRPTMMSVLEDVFRSMKRVSIFILLLGISFSLLAQTVDTLGKKRAYGTLHSEDLKQYVETLTSREFFGREVGSNGANKAAAFISTFYGQNGLEDSVNENSKYLQPFRIWREVAGEASIIVGKSTFSSPTDIILRHDNLTYNASTTNSRTDEASNWGSGGMSLRWARQWSKSFYQTIVLGGSNYNLFYNHTDSIFHLRLVSIDTAQKVTLIESKVKDGSVKLQNSIKVGVRNTLDFGLEINGISTNFTEGYIHRYNGESYIDTLRKVVGDSRLSTLYLQNTYSFGCIKELKFGFRSSRYNLSGKNYFEPRFQIAIQVHPRLLLKASAGRYNQFINRIVLISGTDFRTVWAVSDGEKFPVVQSNHLIAGFTWKPFVRTTVDLEAYTKYTDGIVIVQNIYSRSATNVITQQKRYYSVNTFVQGLDILVKHSFGNYQLWLAYTLSKSTNQTEKVNGGERYPSCDEQCLHSEIHTFVMHIFLSICQVTYDGALCSLIRCANAMQDGGGKCKV